MQRVILNLLNNAVKYTNNGSIDIVIKLIDNNKLEVSVADTGIGISAEHHDTIFELFSRINANKNEGASQGMGLGLAMVKNMVEQLGGTISLESKQGYGSKFSFVIPVKNY